MPDVCLGFEVHQPYRLNGGFHGGLSKGKRVEDLLEVYFDNHWNKTILRRVAEKCYIPANKIVLENLEKFKDGSRPFKVAYSVSGVLVEQLDRWAPDVLDSFRKLAETGCVEFLDQTYYHSLSSLFSAFREEFKEQVLCHRRLMKGLFGQEPKIFENTEFLYNNSIAKTLEDMGYIGVYTEGAERILGWRSPNYVYKAEGSNIRVLLRNYRLSDDVAFRFSARDWMGWPLTAEKYAAWLSATPGQCVNIFIDYETFGEHQWPETGIMNFLKWLPIEVLKRENLRFRTPSELLSSHPPVGEISVQDFNTVSWADEDRSTGAWLGNDMQRTCYNAVRNMEVYVKKAGSRDVLKIWRLLQVSDHLYYMYTRPGASGLVHGYFSSQPPVRAFWSTMRIISDFYERVANILEEPERSSMRLLRVVPPDRAFHFHENGRYINLSAHSLAEFRDTLLLASDRSILFHVAGKHFEKWVRDCVGDVKLADELSKVKGETVAEIRQNLYNHVNRRLLELNFEET